MAAADRISKWVAVFIDEELAGRVLEHLKAEIGKSTSPPREKYALVSSSRKVLLTYNGSRNELYTENLSEGEMYILTNAPFPIGTKLEMALHLDTSTQSHLKGLIIYVERPFSDIFEHSSGTIEFREMNDDDRRIVRNFTKRASLEDIVKGKEETISKPALQCNRGDIPLYQMNG